MKKLNLFLVAIFMIAFVGCQNAASTIDYLYTENDGHEHNWVEFVPTSRSVIGESSLMKCSLCGTVCVHEIEHTDEPTCTESVLLKCKCGKVTHNENALGHDFGNNLEKCNRCGFENPNYVVITDTNANGNEEPTPTEEPKSDDTDTDNGQTPQLEEECKHEITETVTVPSTCTVKGKETVTCKNCNEVVGETELDLAEHTFGDWQITKESTVFECGEKTRTCVCGKTETEVIAKVEKPLPTVKYDGNTNMVLITNSTYSFEWELEYDEDFEVSYLLLSDTDFDTTNLLIVVYKSTVYFDWVNTDNVNDLEWSISDPFGKLIQTFGPISFEM